MKQIKHIILMISLLCASAGIVNASTAFTKANYLVANPTAHSIQPGEMDVSVGYSLQSENDNPIDIGMYYSFNEQLMAGAHLEGGEDLNAGIHGSFIELDLGSYGLNVGGGVLSIPSANSERRLSTYIVTKLKLFHMLDIHAGMAQRLHVGENHSVYYGLGLNIWKLQGAAEYDGAAMNASLGMNMSEYTRFQFAATDIENLDTTGELRVGVHLRSPLFKEIDKRVASLEKKIESLSKERTELKGKYSNLLKNLETRSGASGSTGYSDETKVFLKTVKKKVAEGRYNEAKSAVKEALRFNPMQLDLKMYLANLQFVNGDKEEFKVTIQEILDANPHYDGVWELGEDAFNLVKEDILLALGLDEQALDTNSKNIDLYLSQLSKKAADYETYEDYDKAAELYLMVVKFQTFNVENYYKVYDVYMKRKQYVQAKAIMKEASRLFAADEEINLEIESRLIDIDHAKSK